MKRSEYEDKLLLTYQNLYDQNHDVWTHQPAMRAVVEIIHSEELGSPVSILEVGCGRGHDLKKLLPLAQYYVAYEPSFSPELQQLQLEFPEKLNWHRKRFPDPSLEGSFDLILDNGCLHHELIEAYADYFSAINRVSHPDTRFYLNVFGVKPQESASRMGSMADGRVGRIFHPADTDDFLRPFGWLIERYWFLENPENRRPYLLLKLKKRNPSS